MDNLAHVERIKKVKKAPASVYVRALCDYQQEDNGNLELNKDDKIFVTGIYLKTAGGIPCSGKRWHPFSGANSLT